MARRAPGRVKPQPPEVDTTKAVRLADQLIAAADRGNDRELTAFAEVTRGDPFLSVAVVRLLAIAASNGGRG